MTSSLAKSPALPAEDVQRRVREFIASNFFVTDAELLQADAPLVENGIIDSTGVLEVISFLETEYGIKIGDEELVPENLGSIGRIGAFAARKRGAAA